MKKLIVTLIFVLAVYSVPAFATTQDFNTWGAAQGLGYGQAKMTYLNLLAFPDFTLSTSFLDGLQLDAPGYYGAINYELLGQNDLTITFNSAQPNFSIDLRDFLGYGGPDTIFVYGADDSTLLNSYLVNLNGSIQTFSDLGEISPIGAVKLSNISGAYYTGILQSVTYNAAPPSNAIPEPASLLLLGTGLAGIGLAAWLKRK